MVAPHSKFFTFRQCNSYGTFIINDNLGQIVVIEAHSAKEANERAEQIGLYFDGDGDCPCEHCGKRWHPRESDDQGFDEPTDGRGTRISDIDYDSRSHWEQHIRIHYLDGRVARRDLKDPYAWAPRHRKNTPVRGRRWPQKKE